MNAIFFKKMKFQFVKTVLAVVWIWVSCGGFCFGKEGTDFYVHDEAEQSEMIEFVKGHPEIDFSTYTTYPYKSISGEWPFITYAAMCNYPVLLTYLEETTRAGSRYAFGESEPSPLEMAMLQKAEAALDVIATIRPQWLVESRTSYAPIKFLIMSNDTRRIEKYLDLGLDVNMPNQGGGFGLSWMDLARRQSMEMYELIRSRGGRFSLRSGLSFQMRKNLLEKYSAQVCHLYTNAMAFPDGSRVEFMVETNWLGSLELTIPTVDAISRSLAILGEQCKGTVLIVFHTDNAEPPPILDLKLLIQRLNLAVVRIPVGLEAKPEDWPEEYLPEFGYELSP